MKSLTVICPVYNEAEIITRFHQELARVLDGLSQNWDAVVLYVVDRCADDTLAILKSLAEQDCRIRILALSSRFGHQMSLLAGIDWSNSDAVAMMDSDLQHPPELLPTLLDYFDQGYEVVYTTRVDQRGQPFLKRFTAELFYRLLNRLSDVPIPANAADFRVLSGRVANLFRTTIRERNLFFRGMVGWVGFRSIAVNFEVQERSAGQSKYNLACMMRFGLSGIIGFSKKPLQAAILCGLSFAALAIILAAAWVVVYFVYDKLPPGWSTLAVLVSFFSGVQLFFLGLIGEYLGAIFDEVKQRPHYIVEEAIHFPSEMIPSQHRQPGE
jgi:dolichol-phosphate mannosyltransferase